MRRFPWGWTLACILAGAPLAASAQGKADGPRDWTRALRNSDQDALTHLAEAGVDEEPFLREAMRHRDPDWRMAAVQRVGDLKARWATDTLQARTQDRNPGVAVAARLALRRLGLGGGAAPFRSLVYPGADLDKKVSAGGALEFVLLSRDGARNVSDYYRQALIDLGWERLRDLGEAEVPERCRNPWGGAFGRGPISFLVIVCGSAAPGQQAVIRVKVRESAAPKVFGSELDRKLKDVGIR